MGKKSQQCHVSKIMQLDWSKIAKQHQASEQAGNQALLQEYPVLFILGRCFMDS